MNTLENRILELINSSVQFNFLSKVVLSKNFRWYGVRSKDDGVQWDYQFLNFANYDRIRKEILEHICEINSL
jgi:hypothetical protein